MRTLVIDIETTPHLGWVWSLWDQNVALSQVEQVGTVMCFAAKWVGEKQVIFASDHHDGHRPMLQQAWNLLDEADEVVGYNSKNFDLKHLAREFLVAGMSPPAPWVDIDLLPHVKRRFRFMSNKLDHVARELDLGGKVQHQGFELWRGCIAGDEKSWRLMRRYNRQDVILTEALYERLRPWITAGVNRQLEHPDGCSRCGAGYLIRRGFCHTNVGRYVQLQCKNCGGYMRGGRVDGAKAKSI